MTFPFKISWTKVFYDMGGEFAECETMQGMCVGFVANKSNRVFGIVVNESNEFESVPISEMKLIPEVQND
jgi:hypothetical protein